eukprot:TCALIF_06805-PA protein Name:"Similar to KANK1 KN motif and ankyrin repeat domain-containing protein 1 (Homo sapiens)" AED:0.29 eAED:0.37 QI:0/0/0/0.66/1/1/3/0/1455
MGIIKLKSAQVNETKTASSNMKNQNMIHQRDVGGVILTSSTNPKTQNPSGYYASLPNRRNDNQNNFRSSLKIMNGNHSKTHLPEVNGNNNTANLTWKTLQDRFEIPLPFGYHMDLDFLRFTNEELVSNETLDRLRDLRKQRRKQRKTLEALMGIRQEQRERERKAKIQPVMNSSKTSSNKPTLNIPTKRPSSQPPPDAVRTPEFIKDALKDAMKDFELHLERSKEDRPGSRNQEIDLLNLSSSGIKTAKFNTFPRVLSPDEPAMSSSYKMFRNSNSSLSSISTSSSALPLSPDAVLAGLPSSVMNKSDQSETESIGSITSDMSTHTLKNIREQMAKSLLKLKEYEKQVEAIPVMHARLSVLKEEKRLLLLQLKQRELEMRREKGEDLLESDGGALDYDTEDDDLEEKIGASRLAFKNRFHDIHNRARSESPYARGGTINPEDFPSFQRKRSVSCGYNSDSDPSPHADRRYYESEPQAPNHFQRARMNPIQHQSRLAKSSPLHNLSSPHLERSEISFFTSSGANASLSPARNRLAPNLGTQTSTPIKKAVRDSSTNTDPEKKREKTPSPKPSPPAVRKRDRASNTDPPPKSPPPPRKINNFTNTMPTRTLAKASGTLLQMDNLFTKVELEERVQAAIYKTEEEIMGCPLLQKAMAKVEEEALYGPKPSPEPVDTHEMSVQWVEIIKASKQTDTEDFAFKDTESPRVADMILEPSPERVVWEKRSSLRRTSAGSPLGSRRSSVNSPIQSRKSSTLSGVHPARTVTKSQSTMTDSELKTKPMTRDAKSGSAGVQMKSVGTSALMLPLAKGLPALGSPLTTPELERPPVNLNLCDKCNNDIHKVAEGVLAGPHAALVASSSSSSSSSSTTNASMATTITKIAPPSPDMPWLSKIPRPVPENPDVSKLKSATSIGNLSIDSRPRSPMLQRSKSNMTPTMGRKLTAGNLGSSRSPVPRNALGTPPPHPSTPPVGSRRIPSPLARSQSPYGERRSLIPKLSPNLGRKQVPSSLNLPQGSSNNSSSVVSPNSAETRSLIPRVTTPPALRRMYPKESEGGDKLAARDRNVVRKNTFTKVTVGINNPDLEKHDQGKVKSSEKQVSKLEKMKKRFSDIKEMLSGSDSESETEKKDNETTSKRLSSGGFPLPGAALFAPIDENRTKVEPSKEMRGALKVLNDSFGRSTRGNAQVTNAINIIQQEWFKVSSTKQSNPLDVEDYLDAIEDMSKELLNRVVNLTDVNGNTALHYSVSHGNFDVVSVLLDSKVANSNIMNKAGYTCIMLISLAQIQNDTHRAVVARLFSMGDVNVRATQHGQTALMLAVSHGRADMVQLLVEAGADINIRDEDGSTALMCAAEHGHMEIVKFLLHQPDTNVLAKDNDGLTALAVAMEAGHRDIGVILYANMSFSRGASPYSSMRMKKGSTSSRTSTPTGSTRSLAIANKTPPRSPVVPTPPIRTRRNSSNQ